MNRQKKNKARLIDFRYFLFDLGRFFAILPALIWLKPKWKFENEKAKKPIKGGAMVMYNHSCFYDPVLSQLALFYRRQHFIATKELFEGKIKNLAFRLFKCIEIDRENFSFDTFRKITAYLSSGKIVAIYPEGHINFSDSEINAFKSGIVMMALKSGSPIVPIYTKKPSGFWGRSVFCIGEPIYLQQKYGKLPNIETIEKISEDLRKKEIELEKLIEGEK